MHAPNPMIQEPFFSLPVVPAPTIPEVAVQAPVITPPMTTMGVDPELARQDRTKPVIEHEMELQQPNLENAPDVEAQNVPETEALRRSKRTKRSAISSDYVCNTEIAHMEGDPTSYEEAMRIPHSSKWIEAMEDEIDRKSVV